jgi:hypothetical protein
MANSKISAESVKIGASEIEILETGGEFDFSGRKITNIGDATAAGEVLSYSQLGVANGVAQLDSLAKIPAAQMADGSMFFIGDYNAGTNTPGISDGTGNTGDYYLVSVGGTVDPGGGSITFEAGDSVIYNGTVWKKAGKPTPSIPVTSVNAQTGAVVLDKTDIGLGNVDNTSDMDKPVSTAQDAADDAVQAYSIQRANHTGTQAASTITGLAAVATSGAKADVGLGNVDNTSDVDKPVSTAQGDADDAVQAFSIQRANHTGTQAISTISGLASGVETFLGTPSSANLASALTDETGTGPLVFANEPSLTTPVLNQANLTQAPSATTPPVAKFAIYANQNDSKLHMVDSFGNDLRVSRQEIRNYLEDYADSALDLGANANGLGDTIGVSDRTTTKTLWGSSNTSLLNISRDTNSELRQNYNYLINESGSSSGAFIESPLFTLDQVDIGKPISISFDLKGNTTDGHYQCYIVRYNASNILQSRIVVAGNASSTSPFSAKLPTGTTTFNGFFVPDSTTTTDQFAMRIVSNNSSAASIRIDTLFIGPQPIRVGAASTDPTSYTPVLTNGTNVTPTGSWQKDGPCMTGNFTMTATGAGSGGTFQIALPPGYSIDTGITAVGATVGSARFFDSGVNHRLGVVSVLSSTTIGVYIDSASSTVQGSDFTSGDALIGDFRVPITGWSSNVTMADRAAVEEYASNSNTADASDSSSFVYGPGGSSTPGALTGTQTKRVRFTTPIQPTDNLIIEFMNSTIDTNLWLPASGNYWGTLAYQQQLSNAYGVYLRKVNATDVDVYFAANAQTSSGTYGAAGTSWSSITNTKWRVRKVSAGAQVGYPISSANIVGRTDGNAPATGMVGQVVSFDTSSLTIQTTATVKNVATITNLPAGTWALFAGVELDPSTTLTVSNWEMSISATSATTNSSCAGTFGNPSASNYSAKGSVGPLIVNISAATTYYLTTVVRWTGSGGTWNNARFQAVRIA